MLAQDISFSMPLQQKQTAQASILDEKEAIGIYLLSLSKPLQERLYNPKMVRWSYARQENHSNAENRYK
jgi:hypothetical protein